MSRPVACRLTPLCVVLFGSALAGCGGGPAGPELGAVSGKVTLDGQPLPNATVVFQPDNGRASTATTDASGNYALQFSADEQGAVVGKHTVRILTYEAPFDDQGKPAPGAPEKVPTKYNTETQLKVEVTSGSNEHNFELDSKGEIVQPEAPEISEPTGTSG
jgi:hypothetical protein